MSNSDSPQSGAPAATGLKRYIGRSEIAFLVLIALSFIGIGYTDYSAAGSIWFWKLLVPLFGVTCIVSEWHRNTDKRRVIWTQALHWGALYGVMELVFSHLIEARLDAPIIGLILMLLLALTTFLAGIYIGWPLCLVGIFLATGTIMAAFLESIIWLALFAALVTIVIAMLWKKFFPGRGQENG